MTVDDETIHDVLIVGGGHAGLSAGLTLYRALLRVVIFDSQQPRNCWSTPVHLVPTWDGKSPGLALEASRKELLQTGLTLFVDQAVSSVQRWKTGYFRAVDAAGKAWIGRKLLLALGSSNVFPDLEGYQENFAKHIYPCMFQFGFERRGAPSAGLLAIDSLASPVFAAGLADDGHRFTDHFTIYTNGNKTLAADLETTMASRGISVDNRDILRLHSKEGVDGIEIHFTDGSIKFESFLVHRVSTQTCSPLIEQLSLKTNHLGEIETSMPFGQTSTPGVFAAGDCASMMKMIPQAILMGSYAGCGIARELPRRITENASTM